MKLRSTAHARWAVCAVAWVLLAGCATPRPAEPPADNPLRQARPRSILVLPPLNHTPEVNAGAGVLSRASFPLAESGYYVFPVAAVDETFKHNGITTAADAQAVSPARLREIFGADAALYLDVREYGAIYTVIRSDVIVTIDAKLVDLRTGEPLWTGRASASSAEGQNNGGGLLGMLLTAAINQIVNTLSESSVQISEVANYRLLASGRRGGLLYGPRSPHYGSD